MPTPPSERNELKEDLIEALLGSNAICPDGISFSQMDDRNWFAHDDLKRMFEIIEDMVKSDSPVEYVSEEQSAVCLSSREQAREFKEELRDDDAWWEF